MLCIQAKSMHKPDSAGQRRPVRRTTRKYVCSVSNRSVSFQVTGPNAGVTVVEDNATNRAVVVHRVGP